MGTCVPFSVGHSLSKSSRRPEPLFRWYGNLFHFDEWKMFLLFPPWFAQQFLCRQADIDNFVETPAKFSQNNSWAETKSLSTTDSFFMVHLWSCLFWSHLFVNIFDLLAYSIIYWKFVYANLVTLKMTIWMPCDPV